MKRFIISILSLTIAIHVGFAQTTITGKVTNKKDGTPIAGALIQAKGKAVVTATSDPAGNYTIMVPADVKVLEAVVQGMTTKTQGIGQKKVINFEMTSNKGKSKGKKDNKGKGKEKEVEKEKVKQPEKTTSGKRPTNPPPPPPPVEKPTQTKGGKKK